MGLGIRRRIKHCVKLFRDYRNDMKKQKISDKIKIVRSLDRHYKHVFRIKGDTYETVSLPEVYKFSKETKLEAFSPAMDIYDLGCSYIACGSDIVRTKDGIVWDKAYSPLFSKTVPFDSNLVDYNENYVWLRKNNKSKYVEGGGVSLLGTFSQLWSHFMIQFAAKMYFAKIAGLLKDNITIILPQNIDSHAREISENYLKDFDVSIMYAEPETVYCFERLYFIPTAVRYPNHAFYIMPEDCIFPQITKQAMKECIVSPYITESENNYCAGLPKKLYLARRGTYRAMTNWQETEEFFAGEGFEIIEPHKLTLQEKVQYFYNADFIAGPSSSAFINIVWCRPQSKVLVFSNYMRTLESTGAELAELSGANITLLTGEDMEKSGAHSPYFIDINKIKEAYSYLQKKA